MQSFAREPQLARNDAEGASSDGDVACTLRR